MLNNTRYIGNANIRPLGAYIGTAGVISSQDQFHFLRLQIILQEMPAYATSRWHANLSIQQVQNSKVHRQCLG